MRLILHIGTPKTGTTSIQAALAENRTLLASRGILYPSIGRADHHHVLSAALVGTGKIKSQDRRRYGSDFARVNEATRLAWAAIEKYVNKMQPEALVLSAEGFLSIERFDALKEAVSRVAPGAGITIVCYLRHPVANHESKISQRLGRTWRVRLPGALAWHERLNRWKDVGDVCLRNFDVVGDVCSDFVGTFLPEVANAFALPEKRGNISLTGEGVIALQGCLMALGTDEEARLVAASRTWRVRLMLAESAMREVLHLSRVTVQAPVRWLILDAWHKEALKLERDFGFVFDEPLLYDRAALDIGLADSGALRLGLNEADSLARFLCNDAALAVRLLAHAAQEDQAHRGLRHGLTVRVRHLIRESLSYLRRQS